MKISELIEQLQNIFRNCSDLEIKIELDDSYTTNEIPFGYIFKYDPINKIEVLRHDEDGKPVTPFICLHDDSFRKRKVST